MKKIFTLTALAFTTMTVLAQSPQKMTYQAVIRNTGNQLVANTSVGVQISILQGSATGLAVFIETHSATTNTNGLVTIEIGGGTPVTGSFATINWANGPYFLKSETDPNGGTVYSISGTSQLLSVPYALYAETAGNAGGSLDAAYDNGGSGAGRTITTDAGSVQINNSGTNTTGMEVNTAVNNSTAYLANHSGIGVGFRSESTNPANTFAAIQSNTNSSNANNSAILGNNSGAGYGVSGQIPSTASGQAAVYGSNLRTGGGHGVFGIGYNGTVGQSQNTNGFGIYGSNSNTGGLGIGTYGLGFNGVYGQTTNTTTGWAGYFTFDLGCDGTGYSIGGWVTVSDRRLKSNIVQVDNALEKISLLNGFHYTLTTKSTTPGGDTTITSRQQYGVMAQEVEEVFPDMVKEKAVFINAGDETTYKTVDYNQLVPVLIEAIKELKAEVEVLKKELEEVKK
ncbi:MAG: tail fiber domain-containing protein [Bacteroidota bacterium]